MFSPASTAASRNRAACPVRLPSSTRSASRAARSTNLRMFTAAKPREMPSRTTCSRWPSGSIASTNGWLRSIRRPLDLLLHLRSGEDGGGQLVPAGAGDEHPRRVVDPDLLHVGVVEVRLQRPEAGHPRHQLADHAVGVGNRSDNAGEAPLVVCAHHVLGEMPHQRDVALRVDTLAAYGVAHLRVEVVDQRTGRIPAMCKAGELLAHTDHFPRSFDQLLLVGGASGKRLRPICGQWYASDQRRSRPAPGADSRWVGTTPPTA